MSYHAMPTRALLPLLLIPLLGGCINLGLGNAKVPPALLTLTPQADLSMAAPPAARRNPR